VSAAQQSDDPTGLRALVLVDHEVLRAWNVLLYSDQVKVKLRALKHIDDVVIVNDLALHELGVHIEAILLLDLSLRQLLHAVVLGLAHKHLVGSGQSPVFGYYLNAVIILVQNGKTLCFRLVLPDLLGVRAHSGRDELLEEVVLMIAAAIRALGCWLLVLLHSGSE
jgi:hypothetical protein